MWLIPLGLLVGDALLTWFALRVEQEPVAARSRPSSFSILSDDGKRSSGAAVVFLVFTDRYRRLGRYRKQVAALLSVRYGLAPGGLSLLLEDDDAFALLTQLLPRRTTCRPATPSPPTTTSDGRYLSPPGKVAVLASALVAGHRQGPRQMSCSVLLADLHRTGRRPRPAAQGSSESGRGAGITRWRRACPGRPGCRSPSDEPEEDDDLTGTIHALLGRGRRAPSGLPPHPPDVCTRPRRAGGPRRRQERVPA